MITPPVPRVVLLTDRALAGAAGRSLQAVVAAAVEGGVRAVVVRERDLPLRPRRALVADLQAMLAEVQGTVLVASPPVDDVHGVHLTATAPVPQHRPPVLGRSCHNARELRCAAGDGCDYATLSPIFPTRSKPGYGPALGLGGLTGAPLPVYALGGVDATNAGACVAAGAAGVAVMGAVMRAADPADTVDRLVVAVEGRR